MEDRPPKPHAVPPYKENVRETLGCLGVLVLLGIAAKIVADLHDRPYYRSDVVVPQLSDDTVKKATAQNIPVAATEDSLCELADAITNPDWATALIKGQAVFLVPGGTRLAVLGRDLLSWSISHPQHAGMVLNVRVIDGEYAGKTGYVLASWLNFTDRKETRLFLGCPPDLTPGCPPGRIISIRPDDLTDDDATAIIRAATQSIMEAHPGTKVGNEHIQIADTTQQNVYNIWLPVYQSSPPQGRSTAGLMTFDRPAKCTVRRVSGKWTAELIYFPTNGETGQPPVKIISIRPSDLAEEDATAIIRAASQAIMQAHPGTDVRKENIRIDNSTEPNAYDVWLPVYKPSAPGAQWPDARCTVRRTGGKWLGEVASFPKEQMKFGAPREVK
jgi:hypothetical protein